MTSDGQRAAAIEQLFEDEFGRLRDVLAAPDGAVYLATSNHDVKGRPGPDDDRIIRVRQ